MKKVNVFSIAIIVTLLSVFVFTSCQKEGVYNPKEKISRIFYENSYSNGKQLFQTWTWNDNLLSKITNSSGDFEDFIYNGKKLKTIRSNYGYRYEFIYNGNQLRKIEVYNEENKLCEIYTYSHNGKKISKIDATYYEYDDKKNETLNLIFGNIISQTITKCQNKNKTKSTTSSYSCVFEWDGNNVKKATYEESYNGHLYTNTTEYEYDKKLNPYWNSTWDLYWGDMPQSKNNVIKSKNSDSDGEYWTYDYSYEYDGQYPIAQKYYEDNLYSITYYEYK